MGQTTKMKKIFDHLKKTLVDMWYLEWADILFVYKQFRIKKLRLKIKD